jgi:hypothetical protein
MLASFVFAGERGSLHIYAGYLSDDVLNFLRNDEFWSDSKQKELKMSFEKAGGDNMAIEKAIPGPSLLFPST